MQSFDVSHEGFLDFKRKPHSIQDESMMSSPKRSCDVSKNSIAGSQNNDDKNTMLILQ